MYLRVYKYLYTNEYLEPFDIPKGIPFVHLRENYLIETKRSNLNLSSLTKYKFLFKFVPYFLIIPLLFLQSQIIYITLSIAKSETYRFRDHFKDHNRTWFFLILITYHTLQMIFNLLYVSKSWPKLDVDLSWRLNF